MISAQTVRKGLSSIFNSRTIFFLKIIVTGVTLAWLLQSIQFVALLGSLSQADSKMVAFAFVLIAPNILIQTLKWKFILNLASVNTTVSQAYKSLIAGMPLGFITPGRLGEFGRAFFVQNINKAQVLKFVALDKLSNMLIVVFLGLIGLVTFNQLSLNSNFVIIFCCALFIVVFFTLASFSKLFTKKIETILGVLKFSKNEMFRIYLFSLLFFCIFTLQFCILIFAFSPSEITDLLKATSAIFFTKTALPIAIGDLGIRESASVFFLGKVGIDKASAFNASVLLFIFNVALPSFIGLFELFKIKSR